MSIFCKKNLHQLQYMNFIYSNTKLIIMTDTMFLFQQSTQYFTTTELFTYKRTEILTCSLILLYFTKYQINTLSKRNTCKRSLRKHAT